jgi:hypothetical protein
VNGWPLERRTLLAVIISAYNMVPHLNGDSTEATIATEFGSRALEYASLDKRLCAYTRFYGAAAMTNATLAELFALRLCRSWMSVITRDFLIHLGRHLHGLNSGLADRVGASALEHEDLDRAMIRIEQSNVHVQLDRLRRRGPGEYAATIAQINRLFAIGRLMPTRLLLRGTPYGQVLRTAQGNLGRALNFAFQGDRECIGWTLIRVLRTRPSKAVGPFRGQSIERLAFAPGLRSNNRL